MFSVRCADSSSIDAVRFPSASTTKFLSGMTSVTSQDLWPVATAANASRDNQKWRRANSRPEPLFKYFSNARALLPDLNATAVSIRHGPVLQGVRAFASIVFKQALFEITRNAGVVNRRVCLTHQNMNVNEIFHLAGLPSRSLWSVWAKVKITVRLTAPKSSRGWARQDSNLGPRDYESPALTAELQARLIVKLKHSKPP